MATVSPRVGAVLGRLTLDEKCSLMAGADLWSTVAVERVGIGAVTMTDGPNGARGPVPPGEFAIGAEPSLCVPCGSALGATWNPLLVERVGALIGRHARSQGCSVLLAPTVNLHRAPLGGRNFESYSEDPLLAGRLGAAFVRGAQGAGVATTVKHFAANDCETDRFLANSVVDERALRELHLVPFEITVREGGALGVMTAYNRLNGIHCADHAWLLRDVLRGEWGFEGFVVSDWYALADTVAAVHAGLDLEMGGPGRAYGTALADAVRAGTVAESAVDGALTRLLGTFERIGALEARPPSDLRMPDDVGLARRAAAEAMVLLVNDAVLPLDRGAVSTVAVIGPNAGRAQIMGGGSASLPVPTLVSPLDALKAALGDGVDVIYEPGVDITIDTPAIPVHWLAADDGLAGFTVVCTPLGAIDGELCRTHSPGATALWIGAPDPAAGDRFVARASTTVRVPFAGDWTLALVQTAPSRVILDGAVVIDGTISDVPRGHAFAGFGSHELTAPVTLPADRAFEVTVEVTQAEPAMIGGFKLGLRPTVGADGIDRAVAAAARADATVVVVGTDGNWESEGADRASLRLPGDQDELVRRVLEAAPDAVVVLNTGAPVALPWADRARALLQMWFGGQEMAGALADVLLGDAEPGGRLPTTLPVRIEDTPTFGCFPAEDGTVLYGEGLLVGYRWYQTRRMPVRFPFGHGLSYTRWNWGPPTVSAAVFEPGSSLVIEVPVTNVGERAGSDVVQVYVAPLAARRPRPVSELKGFAKVVASPGQTVTARIELDSRSFARWQPAAPELDPMVDLLRVRAPWVALPTRPAATGWVVDPGDYEVRIGRSSDDIVHVATVTVAEAAQ